jgi:hypothetical protein
VLEEQKVLLFFYFRFSLLKRSPYKESIVRFFFTSSSICARVPFKCEKFCVITKTVYRENTDETGIDMPVRFQLFYLLQRIDSRVLQKIHFMKYSSHPVSFVEVQSSIIEHNMLIHMIWATAVLHNGEFIWSLVQHYV